MKLALGIFLLAWSAAGANLGQITILFDSTGAPRMQTGWGYAAFIEYKGKRVLFDTGPSATALEANAKALGVDLRRLDAVVITHDDPDHIGGLAYVHRINPGVKAYVPESSMGPFGTSWFSGIALTVRNWFSRSKWEDPAPGMTYIRVSSTVEILPGMRLIPAPAEASTREHALALETPAGLVLLTGCAHDGVEQFMRGAKTHVRALVGGMHLMPRSPDEVRRTIQFVAGEKVERVAPGHCTGDFAMARLREIFGDRCLQVGAGSTIPIEP